MFDWPRQEGHRMSRQMKHILNQALLLSPKERAALVEAILARCELSPSQEADTLWAEEAESRIDAYDRGQLKALPAKDVFERVQRPEPS